MMKDKMDTERDAFYAVIISPINDLSVLLLQYWVDIDMDSLNMVLVLMIEERSS